MTTTLIRANDRYVTTSIALADLVFVRSHGTCYHHKPIYELRFKHGSMEISAEALTDLIRQSQEALATESRDPNIAGAVEVREEPA